MITDIMCGAKEQKPGYNFVTINYNHTQVIEVLTGELIMKSRNGIISCTSGEFIYLPRESSFSLFCADIGYSGTFAIDKDRCWPISDTPIKGKTGKQLQLLSQIVINETRHPHYNSTEYLSHIGWLMLVESTRDLEHKNRHDNIVDIACHLVENSLYSGQSAGKIFRDLPVSYRHLTREFKQHIGLTPGEYLRKKRFEESQRLLNETNLTITAIAEELHYSSSQHFSSDFKKMSGFTPVEYRRHIK